MCILGWSPITPPADNLWAFLLLGTLSVLLVGAAKTGFGGSIGLLSVPIMVLACAGDARRATGIMLPLLILCDYVGMVKWRRQWDTRVVVLLLPGTLVGIAAGGTMLGAMRQISRGGSNDPANAALKLGIGLIALGFVALRGLGALRRRTGVLEPTLWHGTGAGLAAGVTSTFAHAAGPIISIYMLAQEMPKKRYVASTVLYYWIGNQLKLVPYFLLGMIDTSSLGASAVLAPAVVAGALLGVVLHRRVGQRQFAGIVYALLLLAGVHLCWQAGKALWR